ncbi:type VI secretion system tube protein TssD [Porphyromonas gulae]|uniref:Type VI secretion system needle protein Hcp n=1 Tax=Porphyromonas gulae TaxID=111105 RepID=A0A0A2F5Y2_9PORP|nr:type VI secretion system tube protein TssD [Porphyromonas gulae]KGN85470.1 hypothetical protein HR15_09720 [Porphyromonas gulae]KKC50448.1 hypothetical protein HR10_09445 [Porphyromonas gulae]
MNPNFLQQPDVNMNAVLVFMGKEYDVHRFSTSFMQPTDDKGEPQAEVLGGKLLIELSQIPDDALLSWASNQWMRKDGEILFRNETGTPPLRISFKEAYCISIQQEMVINQGTKTTIVVSPKSVRLNEFTFESNWVD